MEKNVSNLNSAISNSVCLVNPIQSHLQEAASAYQQRNTGARQRGITGRMGSYQHLYSGSTREKGTWGKTLLSHLKSATPSISNPLYGQH